MRRPRRESPQRRWWSKKESGAPTVKLWSQRETLASSTVSLILVDAVDAALEDEAADDGLVGELGLVDGPAGLGGPRRQDGGADRGDAVQQGRVVGVVCGQASSGTAGANSIRSAM